MVLTTRLVGAGPVGADDPFAQQVVRHAIEVAVAARVGSGATVDVVDVSDIRLGDTDEDVVAMPDQGARSGQPARFTLFTAGTRRTRVGEATAVVEIATETVRTRRAVAQGEILRNVDLEIVRASVDHVRFTRLVVLDEVVGARATRDLLAGATLGRMDVAVEPAVKAGASVQGRVRVAGVEVEATMVALRSGAIDEIVPVRNAATRRTLRGRVTGKGEVEVLDVR
jgi:flagella basal body P-ring formation protein FlgA